MGYEEFWLLAPGSCILNSAEVPQMQETRQTLNELQERIAHVLRRL